MAPQLVAQGTSDVDRFKRIVARQPGEGVTVMELDVPDKFVIPYFFDLPFGSGLDDLLPLIDRAIEEIPGVHLVGSSTYTVRNGLGTFRIQVRTNPFAGVGHPGRRGGDRNTRNLRGSGLAHFEIEPRRVCGRPAGVSAR